MEKENNVPEEERSGERKSEPFTPSERFAAIWGMLSASLLAGVIYLGAFALLIFLLTKLW